MQVLLTKSTILSVFGILCYESENIQKIETAVSSTAMANGLNIFKSFSIINYHAPSASYKNVH